MEVTLFLFMGWYNLLRSTPQGMSLMRVQPMLIVVRYSCYPLPISITQVGIILLPIDINMHVVTIKRFSCFISHACQWQVLYSLSTIASALITPRVVRLSLTAAARTLRRSAYLLGSSTFDLISISPRGAPGFLPLPTDTTREMGSFSPLLW